MQYLVAILLSALAAIPLALGEAGGHVPPAPKPSSPTYTMIANYTGQIGIKMFVRQSANDPWAPQICNTSSLGAACNQPPLYGGSTQQLMIQFAIKNTSAPFRTWKNGTPEEMVIRLDYAPVAQVDRGWRKKNQAYPGHGWHAKWIVATVPFNATGQGVWVLADAEQVTDALMYPEVCTLCVFADGTKDFCQCDRANNVAKNLNTVESVVENSITPAMRGAAIALSVFSPIFLIIYSISDSLYYKRTGKSLRLAHA